MSTEQFLKVVKDTRLRNKDQWWYLIREVEGKRVRIKAYGTYMQILEVDGVESSGPPDCTVKVMNETIKEVLS